MKTVSCLIVCLTALASSPAFGQVSESVQSQAVPSTPKHELIKFDLDFPGGTPRELVGAIQSAMGRPLNAIVPDEDAKVTLPPFKMAKVDVAQLFRALLLASHHREVHGVASAENPRGSTFRDVFYGFRTDGEVTNESIWFFHDDRVFTTTEIRYYLLTPYLDHGLTADEIIAAIQTSWKMLGASTTPTISFQKETMLLIAAGKPNQLKSIDSVLRALKSPSVPIAAAAAPPSK
jgi:hypothetical protein